MRRESKGKRKRVKKRRRGKGREVIKLYFKFVGGKVDIYINT